MNILCLQTFLIWHQKMGRLHLALFDRCRHHRRQANHFLHFFSTFELGGITKHLMTGPLGNSQGER